MTHLHTMLPLLLITACSADDRRTPPPPSPSPSPSARVVLASATQFDLGREIDAADRLGTWNELKQRWQGQPIRWTVTRQRALCRSTDQCNVAAFPIQRPAQHGWMPLVNFAPGQQAALDAACGSAPTCELTLEATLSKLDVSDEFPTKITLGDARIVGTVST